MADSRVAVYFDFDNVLISHYNAVHGTGAWRDARYNRRVPPPNGQQVLNDARVELDAILEYAAAIGPIVVNRAYADWSSWWSMTYDEQFLRHAVDLVQLFPLAGTKNGADVRLAIDVVEDLHQHPHITDVVVVAGDSDYVSLAQRCRRLGRRIVGVGVRGSSARHWVNACDEFKFYDTLAKQVPPAPEIHRAPLEEPARDLAWAKALLRRALTQLQTKSPTGWVKRVYVKPVMLRLDASFDESELGFPTFTAFLDRCLDVVDVQEGDNDRELRLRSSRPGTRAAQA